MRLHLVVRTDGRDRDGGGRAGVCMGKGKEEVLDKHGGGGEGGLKTSDGKG